MRDVATIIGATWSIVCKCGKTNYRFVYGHLELVS